MCDRHWTPTPNLHKSKETDFNWIGTYLFSDFLLRVLPNMYVHGTYLDKNRWIKLTRIEEWDLDSRHFKSIVFIAMLSIKLYDLKL